MQNISSGLAYIEVNDSNPFHLFNEWRAESQKCGNLAPSVMNLATCSRNNEVTNRNVIILKYVDDGFLFLTSREGKKIRDIKDNPNVASTFLWIYKKEEKVINQQVRIEGILIELNKETTEEIYNGIGAHSKIRAHICQQSQPIEWQKLKDLHDEFLKKVTSNNQELNMPENVIGFKLLPNTFDFYYAYDEFIADRVKFAKNDRHEWEYYHVQA